MNLFITQSIGSIIQLIVFSSIPMIWWLISARKEQRFFDWIGLKAIENANRKSTLILSVITTIFFMCMSCWILFSLKSSGVEMATSVFNGLGFNALPSAIVYSFFKTSLSEEILFRGFILKRISAKFGFFVGNIVQSALFGILHGVMFFKFVHPLTAISITLFSGAIGYVMGYINEKKAEGSIIPSWILHGISNLFSSVLSIFTVI